MTKITTLIFGLLLTLPSYGQRFSEFTFGSSLDYFKVTKTDSGWMLGSQNVNLRVLTDYLPSLRKKIEGDCPDLPDKPDLTIRAKKGDESIKRNFYIQQKIIQDGSNCAPFTGEGIYFLPLHRSWFIGENSQSLRLGKTFDLKLDDGRHVKFVQKGSKWVVESENFFANWDFISFFIDSLKKYSIQARLSPLAGEKESKFQLMTGGKTYNFRKVGKNLWAIQRPGRKYLEASDDWANWLDMQTSAIEDRHAPVLLKIVNQSNSEPQRLEAVKSLGRNWNPAIRQAMHIIILRPQESVNLKFEVIRMMKRKPSSQNLKALAKALEVTENVEVQQAITNALRVRNPKGPKIQLDDDDATIRKTIDFWKNWVRKF